MLQGEIAKTQREKTDLEAKCTEISVTAEEVHQLKAVVRKLGDEIAAAEKDRDSIKSTYDAISKEVIQTMSSESFELGSRT